MWLLMMVWSSNTQQIGQDLSHTSQTLPCVQWAYILRVLLDFKPSTSFPPLILYLQNLHVKSDRSVLGLCGEGEAGNLTGAGLSECPGTPDKSLRPTGARLFKKHISPEGLATGLWTVELYVHKRRKSTHTSLGDTPKIPSKNFPCVRVYYYLFIFLKKLGLFRSMESENTLSPANPDTLHASTRQKM